MGVTKLRPFVIPEVLDIPMMGPKTLLLGLDVLSGAPVGEVGGDRDKNVREGAKL